MTKDNGDGTATTVVERDSMQPRFESSETEHLDYITALYDWVYREHLVEPDLSVDTREYDNWLIDFANNEPHLVGILSSVVSKDKNRAWELVGGSRQVKTFGDRLRGVEDGAGWRHFVSMQSRAYYNTNMGAITEIETMNGTPDSPLMSLYHVDPTRARLTGKYNAPLRYKPLKGRMQDWERSDYFRTVSNPDIREEWRGVGMCAVNRCLSLAKMMVAVYEHDLEQLGAEPPKGFLVGDNVTGRMLKQAKQSRDLARRNGDASFDVDLLVLLGEQGNTRTDIRFIPYSALPTDFNLEQFTYLIMLGYALAFGYDAQEFYPVQQGSFGRGAEAELQSEKATYKGEADFSLEFQNHIQDLLPPTLDFQFDRNDARGDINELAWQVEYTNMINSMYDASPSQAEKISREEWRALAAEHGIIPAEWTDELTDIDLTSDTERLRRDYRENESVVRSAERFPDEPIQMLRYDPKTNRGQITHLWDSGKTMRDSHRNWRVTKPEQQAEDKPKAYRTDEQGNRKYHDPILALLTHADGCDCGTCDIPQTRTIRVYKSDIVLKAREAQEGEILFESDDGDVVITTGDVDLAIAEASRVSQEYQDILNATPMIEERIIKREMAWDANNNRYRRENGQFVSSSVVREYNRQSISENGDFVNTVSRRLSNGTLNTTDGGVLMREELKREYIRQAIAGRGGREMMTQSDWGRLGRQLRTQYQFSDNFMRDIAEGDLSEAEIASRMQMYFDSSTQAYETFSAVTRGFSVNDLPAVPCDGTTRCLGRCRCYWDYVEVYRDGRLIGYDAKWVRTVLDSCPDCIQREGDWSNVEIRF